MRLHFLESDRERSLYRPVGGSLQGYSSAVVNANGTSNVVIAGVAGKTVRVHGFDITLASAQALTIKDGATPLTGPMTLQTYQKPKDPDPHFETSPGNDLHFDLGVGAQMSGIIWYVQS